MISRGRPQGRWLKTIVCLIPLLCILWISAPHSQSLSRIPIYIKGREIQVEVAKTEEERAKGLMGRRSLGKNEGMLFIFDVEGYHGFWMKNTLLPLSIAFIDKKGEVVWITDMEPLTLSVHDPPKPVLYALEMSRGWFAANGIKAGDVMRFSK
jgi:uncharacterized protein